MIDAPTPSLLSPESADKAREASSSHGACTSSTALPRRLVKWGCLLLTLLALFAVLDAQRIGPFCDDGASALPPSGGRMNLILMRHAQSENNELPWWNKVLLRMKRDPMLTKKGMAEAEAAAAALTALGVAPHLVLSSYLMRAMETAAVAFGTRVTVAPFLSEHKYFDSDFFSPGSCPLPRDEQRAALAGAGFDVDEQFDWSYVGGSNDAVGPGEWEAFVAWLWEHPEVQQLYAAHGDETTVAVVTHGNYLRLGVLPCGYSHPKNTQAYAVRLQKPAASTLAEGEADVREVTVLYEPRPG